MTANRSGEYKIIKKRKDPLYEQTLGRCRTTGSLNYNMYFGSHFHNLLQLLSHKILYKLPILLCKMIKIQRLHSADRQEKNGKITMRYCVHSCLICSLKKLTALWQRCRLYRIRRRSGYSSRM